MSTSELTSYKPLTLKSAIIGILKADNGFQTVDTIVKKIKDKPEFSRYKDEALKPQVKKIIDDEKKKAESMKVEKSDSEYLGKKRDVMSFKQQSEIKEDKILEEFCFAPTIKMSDIGGFSKQKEIVNNMIGKIIDNWSIVKSLKTGYAKTFLVSGPSGCGKTTFIQSIGGEYNVAFYQLIGPQLISSLSGESESKLRRLFAKLKDTNVPSILFIDEIDTIVGKRENNKEMESRIVAQLKACIDSINKSDENQPIFIIGATNKPESIDSNLRRSGIFDTEIEIGFPRPDERKEILGQLLKNINIDVENYILDTLSEQTSGYVICDLVALIKQAGMQAINRISKDNILPKECMILTNNDENNSELSNYFNDEKQNTINDLYKLVPEDFIEALRFVKPNSLREGFSTIPTVTWNDIGGLENLKETLELHIVKPIKNPALFKLMNINSAGGVLLFGPPGCGKTLLAKAVANASSANFISVKGPELLNKYVGESEKAVRELFKRAKNSQPCVIFFDEFDSLAPKRSSDNNAATDRVVNQLLTVMDGVEGREQVFLIAATNRPDMIDDAMLREGRLGTKLYVPLPDLIEREKILSTHTKGIKFEYNLSELSNKTADYSGADLAGLIRESKLNFLKRKTENDCLLLTQNDIVISKEDLDESLKDFKPSVSHRDKELYQSYRNMFKA